MKRSLVIIDLIHLEQLPNAFSVLSKLPEMPLTMKKWVQIDESIFTDNANNNSDIL